MKKWRRHDVQEENTQDRLARWNEQIDLKVARFGLDPNLPEVQELRTVIAQNVDDESRRALVEMLIEHLDPNYGVVHRDGVMQLHEGWILQRILNPWTLISYFYPSMSVTKMILSNLGMTIYGGDRVIAWVESAVVNPHLFDEDHRRLRNTVTFVKHYVPELGIRADDLIGVYSATFIKDGDRWTHHLSYAPETANIS